MAKVISISTESSGLKWQLYNMPEEEVITRGLIERTGLVNGVPMVKFNGQTKSEARDIPDYTTAVRILLDDLISMNIIASYDEITGVGHHVVAGDGYFKDSILATDKIIQQVEKLSMLVPLHNPGTALEIRALKDLLPDITSAVIFDTAFHAAMSEAAYRYPIANRYHTGYKIRKYGAHGTSHQYVAQEAAKVSGKSLEDLKLITCHIGNGVSATTIKDGKSVGTLMGLTLPGGTMMGTHSGSIDPGVVMYLLEYESNFDSP